MPGGPNDVDPVLESLAKLIADGAWGPSPKSWGNMGNIQPSSSLKKNHELQHWAQ